MISESLPSSRRHLDQAPRTVLVVEDDRPIRVCVCDFLRDCGYAVVEASDAKQARDVLAKRHVDLVFSDINMPNGESGLILEKWIRRQYPDVRVLLTSGYPQLLDDIAHLQDTIVAKPYDYIALWHRFERLFCTSNKANPGWRPVDIMLAAGAISAAMPADWR